MDEDIYIYHSIYHQELGYDTFLQVEYNAADVNVCETYTERR